MNWKKLLAQELQHRNHTEEICTEKYNNLLKDVIRPTLVDIKEELTKYLINSVQEREELKVEYATFWYLFKFKIDKSENCKVKFSASYVENYDFAMDIEVQPKLIDGYNKEVEIELINPDLIGEIFYEAFKPMIEDYYKSGK
ncbi:MAG TPA: hypothetical protein DHV48_04750 [Prolixibacteraceae bacterium]|nr:hypothetical protein [Prolixibacteraceae bacterium]